MTKVKSVSTEVVGVTLAPTAPAQKPYSVSVFGPTTLALQEAAVFIRAGYTPCIDTPVRIFAAAGTISITLHLGSPAQDFVDAAARTTADAVALEKARYDNDVRQAAERMIANNARVAADAKRAAFLAEQKAALLALEKQLAAEAVAEAASAQ